MQQLPSLNIEVKDTAFEGEKGVNEEDNINHMEECNDTILTMDVDVILFQVERVTWRKKQNVFIQHR